MKTALVLLLTCCSLSTGLSSDQTTHLQQLLDSKELRGASLGVLVESPPTKGARTPFFAFQAQTHMVPASVTKLITTAAALKRLGPDFRYQTGFFLDGIVDVNGTLRGNLFIKGAGDPTLGDTTFSGQHNIMESCIDSLQSLGITSIRGNIIIDDSYLGHAPLAKGWAWDDLQYFYGAPISGFNYRANAVDVSVECKPNTSPKVRISPSSSGLVYEIKATSQEQTIVITRELNSSIVTVTIPSDVQQHLREHESISVPNGSEFFLSVLSQNLTSNSIKHEGALITAREWDDAIVYEEYVHLFSFQSPPLREIIQVINTESHNLAADCLAMTLVREQSGVCDWDSISPTLQSILKLPENSFEVFDGSGLSRMNHVSAQTIVSILGNMLDHPYADVFVASLPRPGVGTMKYRMNDISNNIRAKTGSMNATSCLAGYLWNSKRPTQQPTVFCILMNNLSCPVSRARTLQDLMCLSLLK